MDIARLIILLTVVLGLILLLVQNLSPSLPIVFVGMRTLPLPLALWILLSITAGIFTSLIITSLLKFATSLSLQEQQPIPKSIPTPPRVRQNTPPPKSPPPPVNQVDDEFDDWDTNRHQDDWNDEENSESVEETSPSQQSSSSRSSSVYSYSSQEPKNTAVGKTESVYDADYRVIIPPSPKSGKNQATDDDDWDFFEDDDFEDDDDNKPQQR
ncbi:LapA family protein [Dolichospermum sp. ST_sed1]|nr:LapA family protein [Dolichospermum sp. ST_sed1]MDD1426262.1 LapA family protein [Dolichospermum sp. ST_sed9]MDD1431444.1 LapA family protein [Dolichospermum sp. ST_sed6]MDD1437359.1 LapA family protein [Dolichospermum sp. ST_sed10]MDD1442120.1 LapA family protein [Dolichospermum sp. ST_sed3]MDD1445641.1 LapA family protein [Dolichospermum sp. ST_sed8]MDD1456322.1 LapA family protein [Dolichospermum sp. ST_sed7]MDD1462004.1 LapA family protein [Dolichospermum sp. ST_sed2]MDD1468612.1 Lap